MSDIQPYTDRISNSVEEQRWICENTAVTPDDTEGTDMSLVIKCFTSKNLKENTYLVTDEATGLMAVIDPGYYGEDVRAEITDASLFRYILLTHGHFDHFAAAQEYIDEYPEAVFAAPAGETKLLHGGRDNKWMALGKGSSICPEADLLLKEGDTVVLGETVLKVMETPGHTEGGLCFYTDRDVFSGDTLFNAGIGNTLLQTGNKSDLIDSIRNKLYALDDDVVVWPGHGTSTTIGNEKRSNPFVRCDEE